MKASASRRFQPGEGPSRGLLRDCTTSPINRFAALVSRREAAAAAGEARILKFHQIRLRKGTELICNNCNFQRFLTSSILCKATLGRLAILLLTIMINFSPSILLFAPFNRPVSCSAHCSFLKSADFIRRLYSELSSCNFVIQRLV